MKKFLSLIFVLVLSGTLLAQNKSNAELVTLETSVPVDYTYEMPLATVSFRWKDVRHALEVLRLKYPKCSREDSIVFKHAFRFMDANTKHTVIYNDRTAKPGQLAFDYLYKVHIAATLLSEGKAQVVRKTTGKIELQILKSAFKKSGHEFDSFTFTFITGEKFFTGDQLAPQSGSISRIAPDLSAEEAELANGQPNDKPFASVTKPVEIVEAYVVEGKGEVIFEEPPPPIKNSDDPNLIHTLVHDNAIPPGEWKAYNEYLAKEQKYSKNARNAQVEGKVFVRFVVNLDGSLERFEVMKGIHPDLDKEAIRLLQKGGTWKPGKINGKEVRSYSIIPVKFVMK